MSEKAKIFPFYSTLYIPCDQQKKIEKSSELDCHALIFDLEDAVALEHKLQARENLTNFLAQNKVKAPYKIIRINDLTTELGQSDLAHILSYPEALDFDAFLLPKVEHQDVIKSFLDKITKLKKSIDLWIMVETALGFVNLPQLIAEYHPHLSGLVMGSNDLAKSMGLFDQAFSSQLPYSIYYSQAILLAKAYHLKILDGVYNKVKDLEGLKQASLEGKKMGFDGKTILHPDNIKIVHESFAPQETELKWLQKIIALYESPEAQGKNVMLCEGQMVERLHYEQAKKIT